MPMPTSMTVIFNSENNVSVKITSMSEKKTITPLYCTEKSIFSIDSILPEIRAIKIG